MKKEDANVSEVETSRKEFGRISSQCRSSTCDANGPSLLDSTKKKQQQLYAKVNIKTSQSQISSLTIPLKNVNDVLLNEKDSALLSFHRIPSTILSQIEALKYLVSSSNHVTNDEINEARLVLQQWFNDTLGYKGYKLRHIIPRSTQPDNIRKDADGREKLTTAVFSMHSEEQSKSDNQQTSPRALVPQQQEAPSQTNTVTTRKSFSIQKPVMRFHTDSTHTAFTNLWLPMNHITGYFLGFLYHVPTQQLVTGSQMEWLSNQSKQHEVDFFQKNCVVVYHPRITNFGDCIIFRSGGMDGIMHGSFETIFIDDDSSSINKNETTCGRTHSICDRQSVEFRCQRFQTTEKGDSWIYGDLPSTKQNLNTI